MSFYKRYEALCKEKGFEPCSRKMEELIGVKRATISAWNKNDSTPNGETVAKIASVLNVSTDYLLGKTDIKKPPALSGEGDLVKVALFGGDGEVTEEMWQEVKDYVAYIKQKHSKKGE